MTILQVHATMRQRAAQQITRGRTSVKLLSIQTGLTPGTVSNYVRGRRGLSVAGLSRLVDALELAAELLPKSQKL